MTVRIEHLNITERVEYKPVIRKLIRELIKKEGKKLGDITIILTTNEEILRINRNFLNHSYYTDVITFPYVKRLSISGDIYISVDQVTSNCKNYNTLFRDELTRVMIHGVLHLIGYNDNTEEEKAIMRNKEDHYLCRFKEEDLFRQ